MAVPLWPAVARSETPYGTRAILGGLPANGRYAAMPGFAAPLTARQNAQIATYVRNAWGNAAPATEISWNGG